MERKSQRVREFSGVQCMEDLIHNYPDLEFASRLTVPDDESDELFTSISITPGVRNRQYCIIFKNDCNCSTDEARHLFNYFGEVSEVQMDLLNNVFVRYFDKKAAQRALLILRGSNFTPYLKPEPSNELPGQFPDKISRRKVEEKTTSTLNPQCTTTPRISLHPECAGGTSTQKTQGVYYSGFFCKAMIIEDTNMAKLIIFFFMRVKKLE
jgi:hypothetical protein